MTANTAAATPFSVHAETALPEWVDYNGHMNVAYYVLVFDHATDALLDHVGLGPAYREEARASVFVVEAHVTYEREVHAGQRLHVSTQVLGADGKRLHLFHRMYADGSPDVAATNELMILHMDMTSRRTTPFPTGVLQTLQSLAADHAALGAPEQAARSIGIPPKKS